MNKKLPFDVSTIKIDELRKTKIFFGHQSVGYNIIEGIQSFAEENSLQSINFIDITKVDAKDNEIGFIHKEIGENTIPNKKFQDFYHYISNHANAGINIAMMKLCYVDFNEKTDVNKLFDQYKDMINNIKNINKTIRIVHITVPLTDSRPSFKSYIKNIIGRNNMDIEYNFLRNKYNDMLINEYSGKDPVFDIAKIESTGNNGQRISFMNKGQIVYYLSPEYTNDGGHLNKKGKSIVAKKLLQLLSELAE